VWRDFNMDVFVARHAALYESIWAAASRQSSAVSVQLDR
jgi:hypothetical protein